MALTVGRTGVSWFRQPTRPVALWDTAKAVKGAVHAGWRGTLAGSRSRGRRCIAFGSRPEDLHVALGPSIGPGCYEVGDEVAHAFTEVMPKSVEWFRNGSRGRKHLDLVQANADQLADLGVPAQQIFASGLCSSCRNDLLYSYRREGESVGTLYCGHQRFKPVGRRQNAAVCRR
jgi:YfiH family protein